MNKSGMVLRSWSASDAATGERMWWDGHSAKDICDEINATSPRAVKEKAIRSGWKRNPELILEASPNLFEIPQLSLPMLRPNGELVTIATVTAGKECRWIEATDDFFEAPMCGRPVEQKKGNESWCVFHRQRVYVKVAA